MTLPLRAAKSKTCLTCVTVRQPDPGQNPKSDPGALDPAIGQIWERFWALASPYWRREEKWQAWGLLALLVILLLGLTEFAVLFNEQTGEFTSALAARDEERFWDSIKFCLVLIITAVPIYALYFYVRDSLGINWRRWLEMDWHKVLSIGEQQRLAFARLLLTRPQFAILDEATSALDAANEARLYRQLVGTRTTLISVSHHPAILKFHSQVLELTGDGNWLSHPATDYRFAH